MSLIKRNYKILPIGFKLFIMETYYTKKEYKEMENRLKKQLKVRDAKIERLEAKVKKLQKDYDVLLETSTETVEEDNSNVTD